ncbi:MAG: FAD-binding oxidoreductase, partial [bacterium]|nr:FAD-binding oxidoreductase [bacterium]
MPDRIYDIAIAGGGVMGCSTAYNLLKSDGNLKIAVVEPDPVYTYSSTTLSLANIRIQFCLEENIRISLYALEVMESFADDMEVNGNRPDVTFRREGNLFLVDKAGRPGAEKALALQKNLGCDAEWLTLEDISVRYPLFDTTGMEGATFGPRDGYLDAYSLLMGYRAKAVSLGAEFIKDRVTCINTSGGEVTGLSLQSGGNIKAKTAVNCAGAWAAGLAETACVKIPVIPKKRQVFIIDTEVKPKSPLPLTILPSGFYLRSETGGLILCGKSFADDVTGFDFKYDRERFTEILWPELAEFVPAFEKLKIVRGWAGLYAVNTFDGNAILGEWPNVKG